MWSGAPVDVADTTGPDAASGLEIIDNGNGSYDFDCTVPSDTGSTNPTHFEVKYLSGATAFTSANWTASGVSPKGWEWNALYPGNTYLLSDVNHVWGTNLNGTYQVGIRFKDASGNLGAVTGIAQVFASASAGY
jgi:hypothetical protein